MKDFEFGSIIKHKTIAPGKDLTVIELRNESEGGKETVLTRDSSGKLVEYSAYDLVVPYPPVNIIKDEYRVR